MFKKINLFGLLVFISLSSFAQTEIDKKAFTISRVELVEVETTESEVVFDDRPNIPLKSAMMLIDTGKVITVAKDLVALGEDVYKLVIKGKPNNTTSYAPISIVPKINGAPADVFDLENFRTPVKRTFELRYPNGYNVNVVIFKFSVMYSYGGTYNGKGAYLTAAQIIPESVRTLFGWDFNATMKLGGIQNNGTKLNPNAGAILILEYNINSVFVAQTKAVPFFITGRGAFKKL